MSSDRLLDALHRERVTLSFLPTPLAETLLAEPELGRGDRVLPCLRALLVGGDRLRRAPDPLPDFALVNHYGPTESTVVAPY